MILKGHNVRDPGPRIQNYQVSSRIPRKGTTTLHGSLTKSRFYRKLGCASMRTMRKISSLATGTTVYKRFYANVIS